MAKNLPEGYGTPKAGAAKVYAKKGSAIPVKAGEKYTDYIGRCMKAGSSMKQCATAWKGSKVVKAEAAKRLRTKA